MGRLSGRMLFHKVRPTVLRRHHTHIFYSWESNRSAADIQIPAHTRFGRCFYRQGKDNPGLPCRSNACLYTAHFLSSDIARETSFREPFSVMQS